MKKLYVTLSFLMVLVLVGVRPNPGSPITNEVPTQAIALPETQAPSPTPWPSVVPILVLDPGHGPLPNLEEEPIAPGSTTTKRKYGVGAAGVLGTLERDVNLSVSLYLRDLLLEAGYRVVMTRTDHNTIASNIDRVNIANELKADLMVRIHADSHVDSTIHGASVLVPGSVGYVVDQVDLSHTYGEILLTHLVDHVGMKNRGIFTRTDQTGFNWSKVPIVTIEMGFLSNPDEERKLADDAYQKQLAFGLFLGIQEIFQLSVKAPCGIILSSD